MNRSEFFQKIQASFSPQELELIGDAYWLAKMAHRDQKRDDGKRYFEHCRCVALALIEDGRFSADAIILALIHDVPEDCFPPRGAMLRLFGDFIANAAYVLSKFIVMNEQYPEGFQVKKKKSSEEYYNAILHSSPTIRLVKIYDRLDNLSSMHCWPRERQAKYITETRQFIIPIAEITDVALKDRIETICDSIQ